MKTIIELTEEDLKKLVIRHLQDEINIDVKMSDVKIQVKTTENYRTEKWEAGQYRAYVEINK